MKARTLQIVLESFTGLTFELEKCEDMVESLVDLCTDDQITLERDAWRDVRHSLTDHGKALADHLHKGGDPADFEPEDENEGFFDDEPDGRVHKVAEEGKV